MTFVIRLIGEKDKDEGDDDSDESCQYVDMPKLHRVSEHVVWKSEHTYLDLIP